MSFPDITLLVPHCGPALLLDRVEHYEESRVVCSVTIRDDHPYLHEGRVPSVVGIELMAQAVAAYVAMVRKAQGAPMRIGYLVGARRVDLHVDHHALGERLRVIARPVWLDERAGSFECRIEGEGGLLSDATLSVCEATSEELPA